MRNFLCDWPLWFSGRLAGLRYAATRLPTCAIVRRSRALPRAALALRSGLGVLMFGFALTALAAPRVAPGFTAPALLAPGDVSLAQFRGHPVLLEFWASWCGPCWRSFPVLDRLHASYHAQGLEILAVSVDEDAADARRYAERSPHGFALLHDPGGRIADSYRVEAMPRAFLIDADGRIVQDFEGFSAAVEQRLEAAVRARMQPR